MKPFPHCSQVIAAALMPELETQATRLVGRYDTANVGLVILAVDEPQRLGRWEGLEAFLDHLFQEGIPCVVSTRSNRSELVRWLDAVGCRTRLPMRIASEDVGTESVLHGAVMLACNRFSMPVRNVLVVADGAFGAAGGAAAGCCVITIGSQAQQATLRRTGAVRGVADLAQLVPVTMWNGMLGYRG